MWEVAWFWIDPFRLSDQKVVKTVSKLNVGSKVAEIFAFKVWQNQETVIFFFENARKLVKKSWIQNFRRNQKVIIYTHEGFQKFFWESEPVKEFWEIWEILTLKRIKGRTNGAKGRKIGKGKIFLYILFFSNCCLWIPF